MEAILQSKASKKRVVGQAAPTGVGKSLILMGEALMSKGRNLILTSTKPLQDQYAESFKEVSTDLRGQQNYLCAALQPGGEHYAPYIPTGITVDEGPCHFGQGCSLLLGGCHYYDKIRQASLAHNVITNYDLILSVNKYSEGIGLFNFIACDEAHEVPEKLASIMAAELTDWEAKTLLRQELFPSNDPMYWASWASRQKVHTSRTIEALKEGSDIDTPEVRYRLKALTKVTRTLSQMAAAEKDWIVEVDSHRVRVEPLWPRQFVEPYLLTGASKIVFSSATIRPKLFGFLGIEDYDFFEYPSPFPVSARPVWFVPTAWMRYDMENADKLKMVRAVDQIISRRLDRKIIIPTTSFALQKFLLLHSRFSQYMLSNSRNAEGRTDTQEILLQFKRAKAPSILVSPSISTGVDFPGDQCETIIIMKVPFPDVSSLVYKARSSDDSEYGPYIAAQTIVQMAGRGMRSNTDRCETIILDGVFGSLRTQYSHLFPSWFLTAIRKSDILPVPLQKLGTHIGEPAECLNHSEIQL